jgi:hypothetical protein
MKKFIFASSMRAEYGRIIILGIGFFLCLAALQVRPFLLYIIGVAGFFLGLAVQLIATFVIGLMRWRKSSRWWMVPSVVCLAFISTAPLDTRVGIIFADWEFETHLREYVKIVDDVKSGAIPCDTTLGIIILNPLPSNVKRITAARCPDGAVIVVFTVGTGFPLIHTGYLFNGCGENNNCITQYKSLESKWSLRHVVGDWYRFSG